MSHLVLFLICVCVCVFVCVYVCVDPLEMCKFFFCGGCLCKKCG